MLTLEQNTEFQNKTPMREESRLSKKRKTSGGPRREGIVGGGGLTKEVIDRPKGHRVYCSNWDTFEGGEKLLRIILEEQAN